MESAGNFSRENSEQELIPGHASDGKASVQNGGAVRDLSSLLSQRNQQSYAKSSGGPTESASSTLGDGGRKQSTSNSWFGSRKQSRDEKAGEEAGEEASVDSPSNPKHEDVSVAQDLEQAPVHGGDSPFDPAPDHSGGAVRELSSLLSKRNMQSYARSSHTPTESAPSTLGSGGRQQRISSPWFGGRKQSRDEKASKRAGTDPLSNPKQDEVADAHDLEQAPSHRGSSTFDPALDHSADGSQQDLIPRVEIRTGRDLSSLLSDRNRKNYEKKTRSLSRASRKSEDSGTRGSTGLFGHGKRGSSAERQAHHNHLGDSNSMASSFQDPSLRSLSTELGQAPFEREQRSPLLASRSESALPHVSQSPQPYADDYGDRHGSQSLAVALNRWGARHPEHARSLSRHSSLRSLVTPEAMQHNDEDEHETVLDALTVQSQQNRSATLPNIDSTQNRLVVDEPGARKRRGRKLFNRKPKTDDEEPHAHGIDKKRRSTAFTAFLTLNARRKSSDVSNTGSRRPSRSTSAARLRNEGITLFDGVVDSSLLEAVTEKMDLEGMRRAKALIAARVERMVETRDGEDKAMFFILNECPEEGEMITLLQHLITHGVDVNAVDDMGRSGLHVVVSRKFSHAAKVLLTNDTSPEIKDAEGRLPVERALEERHDEMASLLLSHMSNSSVRALFEPQYKEDEDTWEIQKFNFTSYISDTSDMGKTAKAVLDALVEPTLVPDQYNFFFNILESNSDGITPFQNEFQLGCKTNFHRLLEIEELRHHNIVRTLIHYKWNSFGETFTLKNVLSYFVFIFMLSFALISAGRQRAEGFNSTMNDDNETIVIHGDPRVYPDVESYFRAIFEVVVILATMWNLYGEIREMLAATGLDYWRDKYNYVQLTTIALIVVLIPLRWTDTDAQWYVAAITYILYCLRTLQLISVTKVVGIYLQILIEIVKKDVSKFAIIFTIFWIMFSGSLFLILVGTNNTDGTMTGTDLDKIDGVDSYGSILLTGLRIMVQAESVVDDYETNYHWLAVIVMMFFLFTLLIVILNILIAQLSDTYQEVKSNAQRTLEQNWGGSLRNLELTPDLEDNRKNSFVEVIQRDDPESFLVSWEKPVDLTEQREGERRQRFIEQQLAKQDQQLVTIRSQMRKVLTLLQHEQQAQQEMNSTMKDMVRQQLPDVMETIVHRNTDAVITSLGGTTAQSARDIEEHVHSRVVQEVMTMLESATDDVVTRVSDLMTFSEPPV